VRVTPRRLALPPRRASPPHQSWRTRGATHLRCSLRSIQESTRKWSLSFYFPYRAFPDLSVPWSCVGLAAPRWSQRGPRSCSRWASVASVGNREHAVLFMWTRASRSRTLAMLRCPGSVLRLSSLPAARVEIGVCELVRAASRSGSSAYSRTKTRFSRSCRACCRVSAV